MSPEVADQIAATSAEIARLLAAGAFSEAAGMCGGLIASQPDLDIPYLHLARLAEIAGDHQKAAEFLAEAIVRNPDCGETYWHLSRMFRSLGQLQFAITSMQVAITSKAVGPEAQLELADMMFEHGDTAGAIHSYGAALRHNPACGRSKAMLKLLAQDSVSKPAPAPEPTPEPEAVAAPAAAQIPVVGIDPWRKVHLCLVVPDGYPHWEAFSEVTQGFMNAFGELGTACTIGRNDYISDGVNILFGAHLIPTEQIAQLFPASTVIFNLEQIDGFGLDRTPVYKSMLRRHVVWDYSPRNIARLKSITGNQAIHHVGVGYSAGLSRIAMQMQQPVDVLFYGSLNERRAAVLDKLRAARLNVNHLFAVYGAERDAAIADAKLVLNMHFYEDSIHEIVRTSYLLANRKAVVTECNADTEIDPEYRDAMCAAPYDELVQRCIELIQNPIARFALQDRGLGIFSRRSQAQLLKSAMAETAFDRD